jgi:hypothetical protein
MIENSKEKNSSWIFEKNNNESLEKYIKVERYIKNNKFYYKNISNNEIFTNYYYGWGYENILSEKYE